MTQIPHVATQDRVFDAVLIIFLGMLQATALAVTAFATRDAFAALHGGTPMQVRTIMELAGAGALAALCFLWSRRRAEALGQSYAITLRRTLYTKIARLPKARHDQRRLGGLSLRFVGDLSAARLWFGRGLPDTLTAVAVLPGAVAILVLLDPKLAAVGLIPLGLTVMAMGVTAWHLEQRHRHLRTRRARIAISMIERIAIAPDLDVMGRTSKELRTLDASGASLRDAAIARRARTAGLQSILHIGVALSGLALLWHASWTGVAPATVAASLSVLALVALPLQDLGAAWDSYCAWRIARGKLTRLLDEPNLNRRAQTGHAAPTVTLRGTFNGAPVNFTALPGKVTSLTGPHAANLVRCMSGLDTAPDLAVLFDGRAVRAQVAHVDDRHVSLQGSLRRSATLMCRKRPDDDKIIAVLSAFGLSDLVAAPRGLNQRVAENGKGMTSAQTLRLDLARAVLAGVTVLVISSTRWNAEQDKDALIKILMSLGKATIILVDTGVHSAPVQTQKAN